MRPAAEPPSTYRVNLLNFIRLTEQTFRICAAMGTYLVLRSAVELAPVTSSVASMSHTRFIGNGKVVMTANVADQQTALKIVPKLTKR